MQIQRDFSDARVVDLLSTRDESWIAEALLNAEEERILKERIEQADDSETEWVDHDKLFSNLEKRYAG